MIGGPVRRQSANGGITPTKHGQTTAARPPKELYCVLWSPTWTPQACRTSTLCAAASPAAASAAGLPKSGEGVVLGVVVTDLYALRLLQVDDVALRSRAGVVGQGQQPHGRSPHLLVGVRAAVDQLRTEVRLPDCGIGLLRIQGPGRAR
jgi:hypothetical protein